MTELKLQINGMHCGSCAFLIEEELKEKKGVNSVSVDVSSKQAKVTFDENQISPEQISQTITELGEYQVERIN